MISDLCFIVVYCSYLVVLDAFFRKLFHDYMYQVGIFSYKRRRYLKDEKIIDALDDDSYTSCKSR